MLGATTKRQPRRDERVAQGQRARRVHAGSGRRERRAFPAAVARRERRRSGGRASLQRAADPLAGAPLRAAVQDRGRANDRTFRAIDFGDHESPAGRRPAAPRGAVARTRRAADGAGVARSRGRVFARAEDRPSQLRSRPDRLLRRRPAASASNLRLSDAELGDGFRRRRARADDADADAGAAPPHRRARRRLAVPVVELVGRDRRAGRARWTPGDPSRSRRKWRALPLSA